MFLIWGRIHFDVGALFGNTMRIPTSWNSLVVNGLRRGKIHTRDPNRFLHGRRKKNPNKVPTLFPFDGIQKKTH